MILLYVYLALQKPVLVTHRNICWGTTALKAHCSLCHDYFTFVMILISEKVCHKKDKNPDIHLKNKCTKNEQLKCILFVCDLNFIRVHSVFLRGRLWLGGGANWRLIKGHTGPTVAGQNLEAPNVVEGHVCSITSDAPHCNSASCPKSFKVSLK